jgi:hypothetical protein
LGPLVLAVWFLTALIAGAAGWLERLPPPGPQVVLFLLSAAALIVATRAPSIKAWVASLPLAAFVALHLTRFIGLYFVWLYGRGELPYLFAIPCGWGDVVVATSAALLLVFAQPLEARPKLTFAWNALGFFDIVFTVLTASQLATASPASMAALVRLPLVLLPTFLVPLILVTHILMFGRLRNALRGDELR